MTDQSPENAPKNNKTGKIILIIVIVFLLSGFTAIITGVAVYFWQQSSADQAAERAAEKAEEDLEEEVMELQQEIADLKTEISDYEAKTTSTTKNESKDSTSIGCDMTKEVAVRPGSTFDIFGGESFDTAVCGYFTTETKTREDVEGPITSAYLVITEFKDPKFKTALEENIDNGNSINFMKNGNIYYNLGCYEDNVIEPDTMPDTRGTRTLPYLDSSTENTIINSTASNPVTLILSYETREGGYGCVCCSTADHIRLYQ